MIDYRTPPLGYLVRVPQESLDSSLDESARARAEDAARFLSFEKIGMVISTPHAAAIETAEILCNDCNGLGPETDAHLEDGAVIRGYLVHGFPSVIITTQKGIAAAVEELTANVCGEIVAAGGIISVHREEEKIVVRARHMVLDFTFTDFVDSVSSVSSVVENAGP
jgi:hypothetical protein